MKIFHLFHVFYVIVSSAAQVRHPTATERLRIQGQVLREPRPSGMSVRQKRRYAEDVRLEWQLAERDCKKKMTEYYRYVK